MKFSLLIPCALLVTLTRAATPTTVPAAMAHPPSHNHNEPGVVSLDVCAHGPHLNLLVADRLPEHPAQLHYLRSDNSGVSWSSPITVGQHQPAPDPIHRGMDAQIAGHGDALVALWTTAGSQDRFGRGPITSATSSDGGRTWQPGPNPADDGKSTGHAFIDLTADDRGAFHAVWLDGRGGADSGKGLRYARSTDGGRTWSANRTLDPRTCECCWNTIVTAPGGHVAVLYRRRDPRDMGIVRSDDGGATWSAPTTVGSFNWDINGCPHVGGGLALQLDGTKLLAHAVVWTAKGVGALGAYTLNSDDGGLTWDAPRQLGRDVKSWHSDLAADVHGRVVAVWDAYQEDGPQAVFAVESQDHGRTWGKPARLSKTTASATHPKVVADGAGGFRAFWTESPADGGPAIWRSRAVEANAR